MNSRLNNFIKENVEKIYEEVVNIRREIHMNPELGDEEFETSRKIKDSFGTAFLLLSLEEPGEKPLLFCRAGCSRYILIDILLKHVF